MTAQITVSVPAKTPIGTSVTTQELTFETLNVRHE
jgi:hypothetical protein